MKTMALLQVVLSLMIAVAAIGLIIVYLIKGSITAVGLTLSSVVLILVFAMCISLYKEVDR